MDCDDDDDGVSYVNGEAKADSKPFSIRFSRRLIIKPLPTSAVLSKMPTFVTNNLLFPRQFVADTRRKDFIHCWPFPNKYLQVCLKYGISNVLPPFEPCTNLSTRVTHENVGQTCSDQQLKDQFPFENKVILQEKLIKDECKCNYDEMLPKAPCHESNLSFDYTSSVIVPVNQEFSSVQGPHLDAQQRIKTVSPKRLVHKQRKRRGRRKKRSMSDILARAKSCTLEDCDRIRCNSINLSNDGNSETIDDNLSSKNVGVLKINFG